MLTLPASQLLPVPGVLRRVLADPSNRKLLESMISLFRASDHQAVAQLISLKVKVSSDDSEKPNYHKIVHGVLPVLALLSVDPLITITVGVNDTKVSKASAITIYKNEFDLSTNYNKASFFQELIKCGFETKNIRKTFNVCKIYLTKSKALLSLPPQYLSLFISGRIDDVNAAYDLRRLSDKQGLIFAQLLEDGVSPLSALKISQTHESDSPG